MYFVCVYKFKLVTPISLICDGTWLSAYVCSNIIFKCYSLCVIFLWTGIWAVKIFFRRTNLFSPVAKPANWNNYLHFVKRNVYFHPVGYVFTLILTGHHIHFQNLPSTTFLAHEWFGVHILYRHKVLSTDEDLKLTTRCIFVLLRYCLIYVWTKFLFSVLFSYKNTFCWIHVYLTTSQLSL